jgi:hypothetical protein
MISTAQFLYRWRWSIAALALVAGCAVLAARFWHPHYGFTKFVQLDEADYKSGVRELREHPIYYYEGFNGYDGAAYAQIAFHPLLDSPELKPALGNLPYRARRILASALAWVLAAGDPARIAGTYAALNLGVWLVFAALLWRVLPVTDARSWVAWAGVMLSAGALHSVRFALTDLLAATLVTAALWLGEKGRIKGAFGVLGLAGLARETALTAVVAFWRGPWNSDRAWRQNALRVGVAALPLLLWMRYIRWKAGPADQGLGNFTWPVIGWIEKWSEVFAAFFLHPDFTWLVTTTLLATFALTAQAVYLLRRLQWDNVWWRVGAVSVAMMAMLGTAVWEGFPGAATRVLLPMGVAFAVLAVRERAGWGWIAAGSLTIFSGLLALWQVPHDARELAAGRFAAGTFVAKVEQGWFAIERHKGNAWVWAAHEGTLLITPSRPLPTPLQVRLRVRAITPRDIEVRQGETVLFRGAVSTPYQWIEFPTVPLRSPGALKLTLKSTAAPELESSRPGARALGFAVRGIELR